MSIAQGRRHRRPLRRRRVRAAPRGRRRPDGRRSRRRPGAGRRCRSPSRSATRTSSSTSASGSPSGAPAPTTRANSFATPTWRCTSPSATARRATSDSRPRCTRRRSAASRSRPSCRAAIETGQLVLFYQPIVDVASGRTLGVEALVRWNHPRRGLLPPDDFIPIAESTGARHPARALGAPRGLPSGPRSGSGAGLVDDDFYVSVNISARHLQDPGMVDDVVGALHGVSGLRRPARCSSRSPRARSCEDLDPAATVLGELKTTRRATGHRRLRHRLLLARAG